MSDAVSFIRERLFSMQDTAYRDFHSRLIPNIDPETVIGVRVPQLRKFAGELFKTQAAQEFMQELPHLYYEENCLHGLLIAAIKDYDGAVSAMQDFLPFIDNWAVCDLIRPAVFARNTGRLEAEIAQWLRSEHTYTVRFGLEMLLCHYLEEHFDEKYLCWAAKIRSEQYYVKMMVAWYFAEALARQREAAMTYIEHGLPDRWTHNKAIQKALESRRISAQDKARLRTLKKKG